MGGDAGNWKLHAQLSELGNEATYQSRIYTAKRPNPTQLFISTKTWKGCEGRGTAERRPNERVMCRRGQWSTCATERAERGEEARE